MEEINKTIIKIFFASPGDLNRERTIAKKIFSELQAFTEKSNYELKLIIWEDMGPEFGRPQDTINKGGVHVCDIFVGLLWKRWGTPTGTFSSGFEEEYNIVQNRYCDSNGAEPRIWLYFKNPPNIDSLQGETEKQDLQKVLDFRKRLETGQEAFIKTFASPKEWESFFRQKIYEYLGERFQAVSSIGAEKAVPLEIPSGATSLNLPSVRLTKISPALLPLQNLLKFNIKGERVIQSLTKLQKIRLFLFSSSLFYETELSELLGNHEIQLVYFHRKEIELLPIEKKFILRTILSDMHDVKVGWYWLSKLKTKQLRDYLLYLSIEDSDEKIRKGAVLLLKQLWIKRIEQVLCKILSDQSKEVLKESLNTLEEFGSVQSIKSIEETLTHNDPEIRKAAWRAKFAILFRSDPSMAVSFLTATAVDDRGYIIKYLKDIIAKTPLVDLVKLKVDGNDEVKVIAYNELNNRGELKVEDYEELINSNVPELRWLGYRKLIAGGRTFSPKEIRETWPKQQGFGAFLLGGAHPDYIEEVILYLFKQYSAEELKNLIDWMSLDGHIAYLALGFSHFDDVKDEIRQDLKDNFKRIKEKFINRILTNMSDVQKIKDVLLKKGLNSAQLESASRSAVAEKIGEYDDLIIEQFATSALKLLTQYGSKDDKQFAIPFLNAEYTFAKTAAVELFVKYADENDVSTLVDITLTSYGEIRIKAAKKALSLDKENKIRHKFLKSNDATLTRICLSDDIERKEMLQDDIAINLFYSDKDEIRSMAVAYFALTLHKPKLSKFLDTYLSKGGYYYNVVCWIDRILYAPGSYKKMFYRELSSKIK